MCGGLDLDLIFPMHDARSAELMRLKADCLYAAGRIGAGERNIVHGRAADYFTRENHADEGRRATGTLNQADREAA